MGAFVYSNSKLSNCDDIFLTKGHRCVEHISRDGHSLNYCNKIFIDNKNYREFENGDFIIGIGTFVYNSKFAFDALDDIFKDYTSRQLGEIYGHYAFVIGNISNDNVAIFNDASGCIRLYYTIKDDGSICVSSSMLVTIANVKNPKFNQERLAAFLCTSLGRELCPVEGVEIFPSNQIAEISAGKVSFVRKPSIPAPRIENLDEAVEFVTSLIDNQIEQFKIIQRSIGTFSVELTGGLDSRLLSCIMRRGKLDYEYVHYPLFGPDKEIADIVAGKLGKKINIIEDKKIADGEYDKNWGEFDSMFNYYRHYPSQRWNTPHNIQFSGLFGECLSNLEEHLVSPRTLSSILRKSITNTIANNGIYNSYIQTLTSELSKYLGVKDDDILSEKDLAFLCQYLYSQRTGDGLFISAQNTHQYFYSIYNEANFIYGVSNISVDNVKIGRKLSVALIKSLDKELADLPFVSRRRTKKSSVSSVKSLPVVYKSYNVLKRMVPNFVVSYAYKLLGRFVKMDELTYKLDYSHYENCLNVDELKKHPNLYHDIINRLASINYVAKKLNIQ